MRSFRAKPVGWCGESYRHYLAAKGVTTKFESNLLNRLRGTPRKVDFFEEHESKIKKVKVTEDIPEYLQSVSKKKAKKKKVKETLLSQLTHKEQLEELRSKALEAEEGVAVPKEWRIRVPQARKQDEIKEQIVQRAQIRAELEALQAQELAKARKVHADFLATLAEKHAQDVVRNRAVRAAIEEEDEEAAEKWTPEYLARK